MTDTTPGPSWATLPLDQAVVLRSAAVRLSDDFRGVHQTLFAAGLSRKRCNWPNG